MDTSPKRLGAFLGSIDDRCRAMADLAAERHATDPEPSGIVPDLHEWADGQWRRAVPERFHRATLQAVNHHHGDEVAATLDLWVECKTQRPNLLLFGPVGVGKTYAGIAALRPLHQLGATIAVWPVTTFLEATSPGGEDPAGAMASAIHADVLLLDDLGMERGTEWVAERVYEVVNSRWQAMIPTVITTNLPSPDALAAAVGERVWSRLQDGAVAVRLAGPDRRRGE